MSQIQNQPYMPKSALELTPEQIENVKDELRKLLASTGDLPPAQEKSEGSSLVELPQLTKPQLAAGSSIALDLLLDFIDTKNRDAEVKAGLSSIQANKEVREAKNKEKIAKIEEQIKQLEKSSIWDKIGKAFKFIGMAIAAVACVAMIATGVGSAVGVAGLVLMGVALADQILDTIGQEVNGQGWGLTSGIAKLAEKLGASKETAQWIKMGLDLAISIAAIACTLGASAGSSVSSIEKVTNVISKCATIGQGVAGVGAAGAEIGSAVNTYDAEMLRAEQKRIEALLQKLSMLNDLVNEHLKTVLEQAQKTTETVTDIVNENANTQMQIMTNGGGTSMA